MVAAARQLTDAEPLGNAAGWLAAGRRFMLRTLLWLGVASLPSCLTATLWQPPIGHPQAEPCITSMTVELGAEGAEGASLLVGIVPPRRESGAVLGPVPMWRLWAQGSAELALGTLRHTAVFACDQLHLELCEPTASAPEPGRSGSAQLRLGGRLQVQAIAAPAQPAECLQAVLAEGEVGVRTASAPWPELVAAIEAFDWSGLGLGSGHLRVLACRPVPALPFTAVTAAVAAPAAAGGFAAAWAGPEGAALLVADADDATAPWQVLDAAAALLCTQLQWVSGTPARWQLESDWRPQPCAQLPASLRPLPSPLRGRLDLHGYRTRQVWHRGDIANRLLATPFTVAGDALVGLLCLWVPGLCALDDPPHRSRRR